MTCRRSPCTFSSRVIGRSSQSGPLQGVVTLGTIGQMALTVSDHKCQHYSDSVHPSGPHVLDQCDRLATELALLPHDLRNAGGRRTGLPAISRLEENIPKIPKTRSYRWPRIPCR